MTDRHTLSIVARAAGGLVGIALLARYWSGAVGTPGGNLFLNAALLMCLGLVLLSDHLIDDGGLRSVAKFCGYVGLAGMALATVF